MGGRRGQTASGSSCPPAAGDGWHRGQSARGKELSAVIRARRGGAEHRGADRGAPGSPTSTPGAVLQGMGSPVGAGTAAENPHKGGLGWARSPHSCLNPHILAPKARSRWCETHCSAQSRSKQCRAAGRGGRKAAPEPLEQPKPLPHPAGPERLSASSTSRLCCAHARSQPQKCHIGSNSDLKKAFEGVEGWVFVFFFAGGMRRRGKKIWHCSSSLSTTHTWEGWRTEARSKGWSAAITGESTVVITAQHSNLRADKEPIASQRGGSTSVSHAPRPRPTSPPHPLHPWGAAVPEGQQCCGLRGVKGAKREAL